MTIEVADGTLKARKGDYVIYNVEYLLKNLTREVYMLEDYRRWKERFGTSVFIDDAMKTLTKGVKNE